MARRASKTAGKKNSNAVNVDFSGVETRILLPEGIYAASVAEVSQEQGDKAPYLSWKFKTIDDDPKLNDKPLYNNTSLAPQSLWVLGSLLETLGVERPDGPMDIDFDDLVGLELLLVVEHEEYQGKPRSKVVDFQPMTDEEEEEEGNTVIVTDDGEDGETYTTEEINEMDADGLAEVVADTDIKVKVVKKLATYRTKVLAALEEAGLIDDDEEEGGEDKGADAEGDNYTEEEINEMDAEALAAVVEDNDLKVKAIKKIARYRTNVIAALEEAGLIGEAEGEEEEGGEGYTEDEVNEMDADGLAEVVEEHDLKVKPIKKIAKYRSAVIDALEEADLLLEDED
jgi:hypothetical protein